MRIEKLSNMPLAQVPITARPASGGGLLDLATRIVVLALGCALFFLVMRIVGQF